MRSKKQETRNKTNFLFVKKLVFFCLFSCFSFLINAQDSIVGQSSVTEKNNLEFQQFFFKALSEKAIGNYKKAIENLEEANSLMSDNKAVYFELSKNYLLTNKTFEAIKYGNLALEKDPENLWVLEHLVKVYKWDRDYASAVKTQKKIVKNYPKKKRDLVFLHMQNQDYASAKNTLNELEEAKLLTARLRRIKTNLERPRRKKIKPKKLTAKIADDLDLVSKFKKEKSFINLKRLLEKLALDKSDKLMPFSKEGMDLFPAQPLVYLMNGKALNLDKNYKKALNSLQNGIDFVIDDKKMEQQFYLELANANYGLGKVKEANKFKDKALKLSK